MYISQLMFHSSRMLFTAGQAGCVFSFVTGMWEGSLFPLSTQEHKHKWAWVTCYSARTKLTDSSYKLISHCRSRLLPCRREILRFLTVGSLSLEDKVLSWRAVFAFPQEEYCIYDLDYIPALSQKTQRCLWLSYSPGHSHAAASHWNALFTHRTLFSKVDTFWHSDI